MDGAVDRDETEGKIWSPRKKNLKRERAIEAPRCHTRSIGDGTNSKEYTKSKKKGKRRTYPLCFCVESRTHVEGLRGELS